MRLFINKFIVHSIREFNKWSFLFPDLQQIIDDEDIKRWKSANAAKAVTWKQGNIWVQIYPPYDEESIFYDLQIPSGINTVRTPEKAWTKIHQLGGTIDVDTYDEWVAWFSATRESAI